MREFKFRAWNKKNKRMYENVQNTYDGCDYITGGEALSENHFADVLSSNHYLVMQYTGLKDKNGKEIYEGDIVRTPGHGFPDQINEVEYLDGGYWPFADSGFSETEKVDECEIIGNIHENPELLTVTK